MDMIADELIQEFTGTDMTDKALESAERRLSWGRLNYFDEDEILDRIERRIAGTSEDAPERFRKLTAVLEHRREIIEKRMLSMDEHIFERLISARRRYEEKMRKEDPAAYEQFISRRREYYAGLKISDPELAEKYRGLYGEENDKKE